MTWLQRYYARHFFTNSIWILPTLALPAALLAVRLVHRLDTSLDLEVSFHPETVRTLLVTLAGAMFTFVVFVGSALLISVQLASAQLTPRIIAFVFRDSVTKFCLTLFAFIFTYSLAVLVRVDKTIPMLSLNVAVYGFMASLVAFLVLIDHVGKVLRPSGALRQVARLGRHVIEDVYRQKFEEDAVTPLEPGDLPCRDACRTIISSRDGAVLAFDVSGLRALAEQTNCVIELVPQVGDEIAVGDPLFRTYGEGSLPTDVQLCQSVAVGDERTPEQDPMFAFRILVDIASKALSPAINDPTTAVLAIDQIHHLLRSVGGRRLDDERVRDGTGKLRLIYRTPNWQDFVTLAVTEIRQFGGETIQIPRRLSAMLEDLIQSLPKERSALLERELELLNRFTKQRFEEPEDRALAAVSDLQGVGGRHEPSPSPPNASTE